MRAGAASRLALRLVLPIAGLALGSETRAGELYLGAGWGQQEFELSSLAGDFDLDGDAWKGYGGYRFGRYFALELAYTDLGSSDSTQLGVSVRSSSSVWSGSGVVSLPLAGDAELFARGGVDSWSADISASDGTTALGASRHGTDFTYGFGFGFRVWRFARMRVEWDTYRDFADSGNVRFLSAGVQLVF